ncbi:hypothetical protein SISNIDRAFT_169015 [Sistotremastrum niveocremeum HHB9708]|uniref:RING-type domain-containing protein n=1 Tax=Sistotremastrum niveocremeum HHB9708 TaxID=1314777 RepID=A0A164S0M9_9AGAM|nr:hypothetical protein SISNIDRAFT_169015 [Sistotremastrum niveocremeum HHB9708]
MSNVGSASNPNRSQPFDIWDFVHCGICYTTFVNPDNPNPNAPPTVPFWVTECGHVVCNNHLKPDKTCGVCGHTDVAVMAMSRDLPDPMSQWFRPIPARQEELAFASNVQQETVSKLLKHYRRKHLRYKNILAQMKKQSDEDRRKIDHLRAENERLRKGGSTSGPLQDSTNVNGKRRRIEDHGGYVVRCHTAIQHILMLHNRSSSVASNHVIEPPPPERLTLPRDTLDHPPMRSISSEVAPATRDPRLLRNSGRASSPLDLRYVFHPPRAKGFCDGRVVSPVITVNMHSRKKIRKCNLNRCRIHRWSGRCRVGYNDRWKLSQCPFPRGNSSSRNSNRNR